MDLTSVNKLKIKTHTHTMIGRRLCIYVASIYAWLTWLKWTNVWISVCIYIYIYESVYECMYACMRCLTLFWICCVLLTGVLIGPVFALNSKPGTETPREVLHIFFIGDFPTKNDHFKLIEEYNTFRFTGRTVGPDNHYDSLFGLTVSLELEIVTILLCWNNHEPS